MNNEYYNLRRIKSISIADYLNTRGIQPIKQYGSYALYNAPYREDHNASLKVDFAHNLWYDFGLCKGGSIIDLVMLLQGCSTHEAMSHLAERKATLLDSSSFHREVLSAPRKEEPQMNKRRILSISKELPPHLQYYVQEIRKIDLAVASPYLRHIRYEVRGREFSAIGFANRAGGFELRDDKNFKGTIAPKDISLIAEETKNAPYCIFEGFMDFLSYLTMKGEKAKTPSIILNSVNNVYRAIAYLREHHITSLRTFLDNDEAGRQALQSLQSTGIYVEDMSQYYRGHKDLNEYHVDRQRTMEQRAKVARSSIKLIAKRGLRR
ncbi:toprim domain-containing protein [Porphyromonas gingivalis]|uniref:toprim domain-containing protein n=1 Tax=Porphyromonas gingivalis TaxID=837 RepID=UPI0006BB00C5|nr:toprim domain-containing protein [Porphyromonas gingivalis]PDP66196.1 mobilization protein [Porphyromonas gingivalis]RRG13027.1 mobilization protein [Porphyromonas gingivalis]GAP81632.1 mobilization protein [Porphyromonas gingivalis]